MGIWGIVKDGPCNHALRRGSKYDCFYKYSYRQIWILCSAYDYNDNPWHNLNHPPTKCKAHVSIIYNSVTCVSLERITTIHQLNGQLSLWRMIIVKSYYGWRYSLRAAACHLIWYHQFTLGNHIRKLLFSWFHY